MKHVGIMIGVMGLVVGGCIPHFEPEGGGQNTNVPKAQLAIAKAKQVARAEKAAALKTSGGVSAKSHRTEEPFTSHEDGTARVVRRRDSIPEPEAPTYSGPGLIGLYKGDIKMDAPKSDEPMAQFAQGMVAMLGSSLRLEIQDDQHFQLSMMGMPVAGQYTRSGDTLILVPDTIAGMSAKEVAKKGQRDAAEPMEATILPDGRIQITAPSKQAGTPDGELIFTKIKRKPVKNLLKSGEERWLVGKWSLQNLPEKQIASRSGGDAQKAAMMKMMAKSFAIDIRPDYTFTLSMVMELEGTWRLEGDRVFLKVRGFEDLEKMFGGKAKASGNTDMKLAIRGESLFLEEKGESMQFDRQ